MENTLDKNTQTNVTGATGENGAAGVAGTEDAKLYTKEELEALIQSESDKRVTQALKTQQAKFDKQKTEAEKLRNMDEEQRKLYELDQREKAIAEKEAEFARLSNSAEASKILSSRGLDAELVDFVVCEDAEEMMQRIDKLLQIIERDREANKPKGTPKGSHIQTGGQGIEGFKKMTIAQRSEFYKSHPKEYADFMKQLKN